MSHRSFRLLIAAAIVAAHATGFRHAAAQNAPPVSGDWKRLQSANFIVAGNASERQLRDALRELENFRRVFVTLWPHLRLTADVPTVLVLFRGDVFSRFMPQNSRGKRQNVGGYFAASPDVNYMVAPASTDRAVTFETIFHEYTHYVLHRGGGPLPRWANEGLADFYSTVETDRDGRTIVGRTPRWSVETLRAEGLLPFERLLTTEGAANALRDEAEIRRFYAQAWALVHYSMIGPRKGQLAAYLAALERGLSMEDAFREAFQVSYAALQEELRKYVAHFQLPALGFSLPDEQLQAAVKIERMLEVDALYLQGDLLMRVGWLDDAERLLTKALQIDGRHAGARMALAGVHRHRDRRDEAMAMLQAVAADVPGAFAAHYWLGGEYLHARRYEDALQSWSRALDINQRSRGAWVGLSVAAMALGRTSQAGAAFTRARQLDSDPAVYYWRAHRLFEVGLHAAVPADVAAYVREAGWGNDSSPYMAFLGALAHRRMNDPGAADALLASAAATVAPGSWTESVAGFLRGTITADAFLKKARDIGERTEAHAYIGLQASVAGSRDEALTHLAWVIDQGSRQYAEYYLAKAELRRLRDQQAARPTGR